MFSFAVLVILASLTCAAGKCVTDSDCSLLGVCKAAEETGSDHKQPYPSASCECDQGWTGVDCATADLLAYDDVAHLGYVVHKETPLASKQSVRRDSHVLAGVCVCL